MIRRKTNRRHMIADHHAQSAGRATLLARAVDGASRHAQAPLLFAVALRSLRVHESRSGAGGTISGTHTVWLASHPPGSRAVSDHRYSECDRLNCVGSLR